MRVLRSHNIKKIFLSSALTPLLILSLFGCLQSGGTENAVSVNKPAGYATLQSSSDQRSTLADSKKKPSVASAIRNLEKRIKTDPKDSASYLNLAELNIMVGDLNEAEKVCQQLLKVDLNNAPVRKILAKIALRRNQYDLASILLSRLGGDKSQDSEVQTLLALSELKKGENAMAMARFKHALKLNPSNVAARMNLGVMYLKYRQLQEAATQFERVLNSVPHHKDAMLHLAVIEGVRGQSSQAEELFQKVLDQDEGNPIALYNYAVLLSRKNEDEEALDYLKTSLKDPRGREKSHADATFALLNRIQNKLAASGQKVSDEDIQQLASEIAKAPTSQKKTAQKTDKTKSTKKSSLMMPKTDEYEPVQDDISELEKLLQ